MNKIDLTNKQNEDPYILWKKLVNLIRTYDNVVSCNMFVDGTKVGIKVQFRDSREVYTYIGKTAIIRLLKAADKAYWQNLPF